MEATIKDYIRGIAKVKAQIGAAELIFDYEDGSLATSDSFPKAFGFKVGAIREINVESEDLVLRLLKTENDELYYKDSILSVEVENDTEKYQIVSELYSWVYNYFNGDAEMNEDEYLEHLDD